MFTDLFYLLCARGLKVSMNEWLSLMEALERGLCRNSLLEFYYVSRAILVKTEADFDKFDEIFLEYFDRVQHIEDVSDELMDWLHDPKNMKKYDKLEEIPAWGQPTIQKLMDAGFLAGTGTGLDLSHDMVRMLVILDRAGVFG